MKSLYWGMIALIVFPAISFAGSITCRGPNYYPTDDELEFALAAASISDEATRTRIIGSERLHLNTCASELRHKLCSDDMIMGLLDKKSSMIGGAAGLVLSRDNIAGGMLTGALLGGLIGTTTGATKYANCNARIAQQVSPIADKLVKLPHGSAANLQLFLDAIDRSTRGQYPPISQGEAQYLTETIQDWVRIFRR